MKTKFSKIIIIIKIQIAMSNNILDKTFWIYYNKNQHTTDWSAKCPKKTHWTTVKLTYSMNMIRNLEWGLISHKLLQNCLSCCKLNAIEIQPIQSCHNFNSNLGVQSFILIKQHNLELYAFTISTLRPLYFLWWIRYIMQSSRWIPF